MRQHLIKALYPAAVILLIVLCAACGGQHDVLTAGAACVNISPENPAGLCLEGYTPRFSTGLHDSLSARCLVINDGTTNAVFVTLDLLGLLGSDMHTLAGRIQDETGTDTSSIFIHTTHTHSAPAMIGFNGSEVNIDYKRLVFDRTVTCVKQAIVAAKPATIRIGSGVSHGVTVNRRNPDRPLDNELSVMDFRDSNGETIATFVNFACHPVTQGPENTLLTADFVYYLRRNVEAAHGGVTMFINGAIGDVNPKMPEEAVSDKDDPYAFSEIIGKVVGDDALEILATAKEYPIRIRMATRTVLLPVENPMFLQIADMPAFENPIENGRWKSTISIIDFGLAQMLTIPGEALSGYRNALEPLLPGDHVFFSGLTNDCIGYIIPEAEWENASTRAYEEMVSLSGTLGSALEEEYTDLAGSLFSR